MSDQDDKFAWMVANLPDDMCASFVPRESDARWCQNCEFEEDGHVIRDALLRLDAATKERERVMRLVGEWRSLGPAHAFFADALVAAMAGNSK